jgi:hypothetical protein
MLGDPRSDLGSRGEAELGEDVLDMSLRRSPGDHKAGRDVPVAQAVRDQVGDLAFSPRESDRGIALVGVPASTSPVRRPRCRRADC